MANRVIENEYAKFWIEKGILYTVYKNSVSLNESAAIKIVENRLTLQQGKSFLILSDVRGLKNTNKNTRNYFAMESSVPITAVALLVNSPLDNTLPEFFIKANNPVFKIETFTEKENALEFLNNYTTTPINYEPYRTLDPNCSIKFEKDKSLEH
ncbi:hypothetical protein Q4Q39_19250 [Flavivirga amylovorans]|uniref:DUF7793 domain-containing protein n=1 Tax=Flavivirga amylovorans TaxID=870486 RepID=A0ABT8X6T2_9FLAO|nr:hypothetical protein [Flavivirga amylovorans]MDO5989547.1 hypothetical protein [Flavivirga amylovorans]